VVGDVVLAMDETGRITPQPVTTLFRHNDAAILEVETEAATLRTTREHPLWMGGDLYRDAGDLKPGDKIMRYVDGHVTATIVRSLHENKGRETVYNIEVDTIHTYVAGGFVVHNKVAPTSTGVTPTPTPAPTPTPVPTPTPAP
jgi:hypothetical protein